MAFKRTSSLCIATRVSTLCCLIKARVSPSINLLVAPAEVTHRGNDGAHRPPFLTQQRKQLKRQHSREEAVRAPSRKRCCWNDAVLERLVSQKAVTKSFHVSRTWFTVVTLATQRRDKAKTHDVARCLQTQLEFSTKQTHTTLSLKGQSA